MTRANARSTQASLSQLPGPEETQSHRKAQRRIDAPRASSQGVRLCLDNGEFCSPGDPGGRSSGVGVGGDDATTVSAHGPFDWSRGCIPRSWPRQAREKLNMPAPCSTVSGLSQWRAAQGERSKVLVRVLESGGARFCTVERVLQNVVRACLLIGSQFIQVSRSRVARG